MPEKKERIKSHIDQLVDMEKHYPEAVTTFKMLTNHLRGLNRVNSSREPQRFNSLKSLEALKATLV